MKILVSACLLGHKVRYNGSALTQAGTHFEWLINNHQIIPFCPEVSAGLPTPRPPAEIRNGTGQDVLDGHSKIYSFDGKDLSAEFLLGAKLALAQCQAHDIQFAVLTESSPSCGSGEIYNGEFNRTKQTGSGVTTALLRQNGIQVFGQHQFELLRLTLKERAVKPL